MKIKDTQLKWDEQTNSTLLITQYEDGSLLCEEIDSEQAAQKQAELKY